MVLYVINKFYKEECFGLFGNSISGLKKMMKPSALSDTANQ